MGLSSGGRAAPQTALFFFLGGVPPSRPPCFFFGRSGGRDHNAPCFGTISWKERTLNDGSGHYPNDGNDHYLWQRPLASRNF